MFLKDIKTGTQVQLSRKGADPQIKPYMTRVEVVEDNNTILIHAPLEKGARVKLVERNLYKLCFISEGAQINFEGKLMEAVKIDGFHMLRFSIDAPGEKIQRRNAFRFACTLPFTFNVIADDGRQSPRIEGVIRDLSSGGIKIVTKANIPDNVLLRIDLNLDEEYIMAFGQIRMKKHVPDNIKYPYTYGISFELLPEADEERIVRYVYNEQRKLLKRPQKSLYKSNKK